MARERDIGTGEPLFTPEQAELLTSCYEQSWAVVIGINEYSYTDRLQCARADAELVSGTLAELGFSPGNITTLTDADATRQNIQDVLSVEMEKKTGKNDRLFVFFAGHGQDYKTASGKTMGFFLPVDADPGKLTSRGISMDEVGTWSDLVPAKHILYVMDCCYSGIAATRSSGLRQSHRRYLSTITSRPVRQIITAGRADQKVIEEAGHGVFTRALVRGMRGDADLEGKGYVTGQGLGFYLTSRVVEESRNRQEPQFRYLTGDGDFLVSYTAGDGEDYFSTAVEPDSGSKKPPVATVGALTREATVEYKRAVESIGSGDADAALASFDEMVRLDSRNPETWRRRGNFHRRSRGDAQKALKDYDEALGLEKEHLDSLQARSGISMERGDYEAAIMDCTSLIRLDSRVRASYLRRAGLYSMQGELEEAVADYSEVIRLLPEDPDAWFLRAGIFARQGDYEKAVSDYGEVLKLLPGDAEAYLQRSLVFRKQGDNEAAESDYSRSLELALELAELNSTASTESEKLPAELAALEARGLEHFTSGEYPAAIDCHTRVIELHSGSFYARYYRGLACSATGAYQRALEDFKEARLLEPADAELRYQLGKVYRRMGDEMAAVTHQTRAISLRENYVDAYLERGRSYDDEDYYSLALSDFAKVLELEPENASAYCYRGLQHHSIGDGDRRSEALSDYSRAIELEGDYAEAHYYRALLSISLGHHEQAFEDCTLVIEICGGKKDIWDPAVLVSRLAGAYFYRGVAGYFAGSYEAAIKDYEAACELRYDRRYYQGLGLAFRESGEEEKAGECFEKAGGASLDPIFKEK